MKLFLSHSSADDELVANLVALLEASIPELIGSIRASSCPGRGLPAGSPLAATIVQDLRKAEVVVGLISNNSVESQWVLFELGAAYALGKSIVPLLHPRADVGMVPAPLQGTLAGVVSDRSQLITAVEHIATLLSSRIRRASAWSHVLDECLEGFETLALPQGAAAGPDLTQMSLKGDLQMELLRRMDPTISEVFGESISFFVERISDAVEKRTIYFREMSQFRYHYRRALGRFPKAHFYATSLPYERYFWRRPPTGGTSKFEGALRDFIDNGGQFTRVFFMHPSEFESAEVAGHSKGAGRNRCSSPLCRPSAGSEVPPPLLCCG